MNRNCTVCNEELPVTPYFCFDCQESFCGERCGDISEFSGFCVCSRCRKPHTKNPEEVNSYKKKHNMTFAIQFTDASETKCLRFVKGWWSCLDYDGNKNRIMRIQTFIGTIIVRLGDYIVHTDTGEFIPYTEKQFKEIYE